MRGSGCRSGPQFDRGQKRASDNARRMRPPDPRPEKRLDGPRAEAHPPPSRARAHGSAEGAFRGRPRDRTLQLPDELGAEPAGGGAGGGERGGGQALGAHPHVRGLVREAARKSPPAQGGAGGEGWGGADGGAPQRVQVRLGLLHGVAARGAVGGRSGCQAPDAVRARARRQGPLRGGPQGREPGRVCQANRPRKVCQCGSDVRRP
mmetsp:Transcript_1068/g.2274  ORF Transcript_1068/g.2274 Transcript_1068/m.2274 type:complete len:206 (-) Transcript_1068:691-1308(-)